MTMPATDPSRGFEVARIPGVSFLDVADPRLPATEARHRLAQLVKVHSTYFPDYSHVFGEWEEGLFSGWPDDEVVIHLWLLLADDRPIGEVILHSNLRRSVVLVHFVAVDPDIRHGLPHDWLFGLAEAFRTAGQIDADAAGTTMCAVMGEIPPAHFHKWNRVGFQAVDVDYAEPLHGKHWVQDGQPRLSPMLAIINPTGNCAGQSLAEIAEAGLRGYVFDYYELPPEHPQVVAMLDHVEVSPAP